MPTAKPTTEHARNNRAASRSGDARCDGGARARLAGFSASKWSSDATRTKFAAAPATPRASGKPAMRPAAPGPTASSTSETTPQSVHASAWSRTKRLPPSKGIQGR